MLVAQLILLLASLYTMVGLLFAIFFVAAGVHLVDPASRGASWGFRILILPGTAALWPVTLNWWRRARRREISQ